MRCGVFVAIITSLVTFGFLCLLGVEITDLREQIATLQIKDYQLEQQIEASEDKCERMTDTCIDIVVNRRWEE